MPRLTSRPFIYMKQKSFVKLILLGSVLVIFVVLVGGVVLSSLTCPRPSKTGPAAVDFYSCSQDSDCVLVKADCCGCSAGGKAAAINKNFEKEWGEKLSKECQGIKCLDVLSNDPSCFKKPKCIDNKCALEEPEKTTVDPRCGQKVKFDPMCQIAIVVYGYEFDSFLEKCKEVNAGGGCDLETPFNSLEECQKVCEGKIDFYSCNQDSDCIKVKADCCGCTAGGSATAINKTFKNQWKNNCNEIDIDCPTVMSNDPSCFKEPKCVENKCVLEEPKDICDIGKGDWDNGIFNGDNSDLSVVKSQCEQKSDCEWRPLGGKIVSHFACCPKDLISLTEDEIRSIYGRCFILID